MLLLREPSDARIRRFLAEQQALPFSYPEAGASRVGAPPGYPINRLRGHLGAGAATFARAVDAVRHWRMYDLPWTRLCWPATPIEVGANVAVVARHLGLWSLNACRIIYLIEEDGAVARYGFAFGTLPGHVEQGEERFTVEWRRHDDAVWYELFAFARPGHPLARAGYPLARLIQKRFAAASYGAMRMAASGERT